MTEFQVASIPESEIVEMSEALLKKWRDGDTMLCGIINVAEEWAARHLILNYLRGMVASELVMKNDTYQVHVRRLAENQAHLSIRRLDRDPIHDWRELQKIKNAILGPECEAVELYPAESRLVDTANQYHLWAYTDLTLRFPFGFDSGRYATNGSIGKSVQRPMPESEVSHG
jgi:hypothetical protein